MTQEIDVQTLQNWLAQKKPVTILDIRRQLEDREQWWIPGSQHVDAYRSLKEGSAGALLNASFPANQPVVTVCGSGRVSRTAAEALASQRGIPAFSLTGGMKAWSLAWNTASQSVSPVEVTQVRRTGKGCLSYLIRSQSDAAVIDPSVEPEVYLPLAGNYGASIRSHPRGSSLSRPAPRGDERRRSHPAATEARAISAQASGRW
jgi:rhodanese-related sulfurtransferase